MFTVLAHGAAPGNCRPCTIYVPCHGMAGRQGKATASIHGCSLMVLTDRSADPGRMRFTLHLKHFRDVGENFRHIYSGLTSRLAYILQGSLPSTAERRRLLLSPISVDSFSPYEVTDLTHVHVWPLVSR
ncbi:hypothetical protein PAHAL_3G102700 [Panicum hallii]|jgi:hypothetical protein|uniref:Uncharacterized protein n=1 Tax=Panicum hallii TaxID=206008 RepID=A0A2T8KHR3_9POAL|nr:hypothetical protein PAHAL_3G102700 [Panicum hallii]